MSSEIEQLIAEAQRVLPRHLGSRGAAHSRAVAETAASLAREYGADERRAFLGGLLHDWARDVPAEELLKEAARRGIPVTEVDREVPYLLHAAVGAAQARDALGGLPEDVFRAVERHTLAAPGMTALEAIVFVADMLEPGRDYPAAEELRSLAGSAPLPVLFVAAYARSLTHVIETRRHLHPASVPAWNAAIAAAEGLKTP
ncbi:MAG: bis(5'-nucleosyl)-tetraphosphatase (symmetrical) YqeK [Coriobacteriia bacterium]|nr:bis(5'-nucleosyl)-tetraphosphatase (symmetrical) YqeK [Coriobacteriia bacterium]